MSGSHHANPPEQHGAYFSAAPDETIQYDLPSVVCGELHVGELKIDATIDGHTPPDGAPAQRVLGKETPRQLASIQLTPEQLTVGAGALAPDDHDITPWPEQVKAELAALRVELVRQANMLNYAHLRIDEQAREIAALRTAVVQHADALTVLNLRSGA